jgi:hypothetical protein
MTFNPFEENEQYMRQKDQVPIRLLKQGAAIGTAAFGGSSLINRILPLLSEYVPEELAKKGIAKISPKLGNFVESATNLGHDFYEVRDFIRGKAAEQEEEGRQSKSDKRNIIEQYSPELHQYISDEIQKGRAPLEAGALASLQEIFKEPIKKITKDHKAPFASIIETIYGPGQSQSQAAPQQMGGQQIQPPGPGGQGGQGKAALLQTMQEITKALQQRM